MAKRQRDQSQSPAANASAGPRKRILQNTQSISSVLRNPEPAYNPKLDPLFPKVLGDGSQRVNLGIDFGTSSCAAYFAIVPEGEVSPLNVKTVKLDLQRSVSVLPAYVALKPINGNKDAMLIFGRDIVAATEADEMSWNDVWLDLKQADFLLRVDELPIEKQQDIIRLHAQHDRILRGASQYRKIIYRHGWIGEEVVELNTMEDVVHQLLKYFLMEIKSAIRRQSVLSKEITNDLFSGGEGAKYGDRARVGVAIPEVWTWQRMVIYRIFRNAGFHQDLELLSEGRCALAKGIIDVCEEHMRGNNTFGRQVLNQLKRTVFVGFDEGGYTLDGAIMELVERKSLIKLAVIGEGHSSQHGSNRANDIFKHRAIELFGRRNIPHILKQIQVSESNLLLNLERGFETAKCDIDLESEDKVQVVYRGLHGMKQNRSSRADWTEKSIRINRTDFLSCLQDALEEKFADEGPVPKLLEEAEAIADGRSVHVIFSGGGSKSELLHIRALEDIGKLNMKVSFAATGSASCVAEGACIMLSDPDLSRNSREAKKSYGIVVTEEFDVSNAIHNMRLGEKTRMLPHATHKVIAEKEDMPRTVVWKVKLNDPVRFQMQEQPMQHTIWTEDDGRDHPGESSDGWLFEIPIVETSDPIVGSVDGYSADHALIKNCGTLSFPIDRELSTFIGRRTGSLRRAHGFNKDEEGLWRLDFEYVLSYQWRGMLQYFEVKIPRYGVFWGKEFDEETKNADSSSFGRRRSGCRLTRNGTQ